MERIRPTLKEIVFIDKLSSHEQQTVTDCENFRQALDEAIDDNLEWKRCDNCELRVRTYSALDSIFISQRCFKE